MLQAEVFAISCALLDCASLFILMGLIISFSSSFELQNQNAHYAIMRQLNLLE